MLNWHTEICTVKYSDTLSSRARAQSPLEEIQTDWLMQSLYRFHSGERIPANRSTTASYGVGLPGKARVMA